MTTLPVPITANLPASLASDLASAVDLALNEKAASTRRAYKTDFRLFRAYCDRNDSAALPASPETVAACLASEMAAGCKASTLGRRVAAIRYAHKLAGHDTPSDSEAVKATLRGIRRSIGAAKVKKAPALADKVRLMSALSPDDISGLRDRALLLLGFAGALRRSELVALDVHDLQESPDGLRVTIRQSKTDQEGAGQTIASRAVTRPVRLRPSEPGWMLLVLSRAPYFVRSTKLAPSRPIA